MPQTLLFITGNANKLREVQAIFCDLDLPELRAVEIVGGPVLVEDTALGLNNILAAYSDKSAEAICTFACFEGPGKEVLPFQGKTKGRIVPARGPGDFGWDAVFEYEGQKYAEMDNAEKNKISHPPSKALAKLAAWLKEHEAQV
ncbi:Maf/Ham1 [Terfezia boudieri ATCC MYA-4762]|uniref:Maf/Ham1 n=1 Tax=Terfezia boudieri ATCC MYA-4762 TaxID=1051890 RepID=A0A3N4LFP1_9PEZI|nr:Maf/Ham1 [Terfezia boudieri ATCC MYA-4762]